MSRTIIATAKSLMVNSLLAKLLVVLSLVSTSLLASTAAHAERLVQSPLMPSARGLFFSPYAPAEAVTCEERYDSVCARPCKTWAGAQPDFEFSYDVCVAKCPKPIRGTCR